MASEAKPVHRSPRGSKDKRRQAAPRPREGVTSGRRARFSRAAAGTISVKISLAQIKQLAPNARQEYLDAFGAPSAESVLASYGILDSPLRLCHFLAQAMTETGALHTLIESLNYSASRLIQVWPKHFHNLHEAEPYAHNEEKLANFIYGQTTIAKVLGNDQPGDGFKYRGRGLLQITGRDAYTRYGGQLSIDLVNNPDLAFVPEHSLSVAGIEWASSGFHGRRCNELADADDIEGVTYAINGGQTGIDDRKLWLDKAKAIWMPDRARSADQRLSGPDLMLASRAMANLALAAETGPSEAFATKAVQIATAEWETFGKQEYDLSGHLVRAGHKEGEEPWYKRIGTYWSEGVRDNTLNGRDDVPWSAAFISWVMRTAGAGSRFVYSPQHSVYISRAIRDLLQNRVEAGYWCYRLQEHKPLPGDIVCWGRQAGIDYDHQNGGSYKGHCDLVVAVRDDAIDIIGGNIGNSVTKRPVALNQQGFIEPIRQHGENLFAIMACRI